MAALARERELAAGLARPLGPCSYSRPALLATDRKSASGRVILKKHPTERLVGFGLGVFCFLFFVFFAYCFHHT